MKQVFHTTHQYGVVYTSPDMSADLLLKHLLSSKQWSQAGNRSEKHGVSQDDEDERVFIRKTPARTLCLSHEATWHTV